MSFEITVNIPSLDRVAAAIEKLVDAANAQADRTAPLVASTGGTEGKATRTAAAKKDTPAAAAGSAKQGTDEAQAGASTSTTAQTDASPSETDAPSYDAVKKAAQKLATTKGRPALVKALIAHGVDAENNVGISAMAESEYAGFIATCQEAMAS